METRFTLEVHVYGLLCEQFVSILVIEDVDVVYRQEFSAGYGYVCHAQEKHMGWVWSNVPGFLLAVRVVEVRYEV